jgi:hypothetical protein
MDQTYQWHLQPLTPEMGKALESWQQTPQLPQPTLSFYPQSTLPVMAMPAQDVRPLSEILGELFGAMLVTGFKHFWKDTDPDSYAVYQTTFALAPYWPSSQAWMLNAAALGSAAYGASRVCDRIENARTRRA